MSQEQLEIGERIHRAYEQIVIDSGDASMDEAIARFLREGGTMMRWCTRTELELMYGVHAGALESVDGEIRPLHWSELFRQPEHEDLFPFHTTQAAHYLRLEILDAMKRRNEETNRLGALLVGALGVAAFPGGGGIPGMGRRRETPITDEEQAAFDKAVDDAEKAAEARGEEAKASAQARRDRRAQKRLAHRHG